MRIKRYDNSLESRDQHSAPWYLQIDGENLYSPSQSPRLLDWEQTMTLSLQVLRDFEVPANALSLWWLGHAGFIVKSPQGMLAAIDPYLSDVCAPLAAKAGLDCHRLRPPPIAAEELVGIDLYVFTHSHEDHLDPETVAAYRRAGGTGPYLAPAETKERLKALGVPDDHIVLTWPNKVYTIGDVTFRSTFAVPSTGDDLTHVGYLVSGDNGTTVYLTGDSAYHDVLGATVAQYEPDVMLTVINEAFRNMGPADAARLASQIRPKVVIPYHYGLFSDGGMDPRILRNNLLLYDMQDAFRTLRPGDPYTFPEAG
jgi:L-ascorbate 6-phosphate lactonase